ncbi:MAG: phosphatase PAP2 family protein [Deltaproteobacteria bacterium]
MRLAPIAAGLIACLVAQGVRAGDETVAPVAPSAPPAVPSVPADPPRLTKLSYDWTVDGITTGVLAASTIALMLLDNQLAPLQCRWCVPGTLDGNLSTSARWANPHAANTWSDVLQFAVPIGVMGFGLIQAYRFDDPAAGWSSVLLITQATSLAMLASTIVKYSVGRARPYVWQGTPDLYPSPSDANVSFFSGHVTFVFAVVVSGSTLFFMQDMPGAPYVLGFGLAAAALTGYLRIAADKHYLTDVLVGAGVGSLIGWAVPYLFHRPGKKGPPQAGDIMPAPGGVAIAW